jgi:mono/diheme cytochrome c family protein
MHIQRLLVMTVLAGFVGQLYAQQTPTIKRENAPRTDLKSGSEMFSTYCAVCHGPDGKGNGPAAVALKKQPANLTQLSKKNGGQFPSAKVSFFIEGREVVVAHGSRDMPIWGRIFRDMEDEDLVRLRIFNLTEYVRSLQEK